METRAVITSKFGAKGYSAKSIARVVSAYVDSAMDSDADNWQLSIGDIDDDLINTLRRDNEVRVSIFALDNKLQALHTGFADEVALDETEILQLSGRDITAPAVDSILLPHQYKNIRPHTFVGKLARELGIGTKLRLAAGRPFKKYNTDGSETYWEAMYRFYRKRRMWLWAEPDGWLVGDNLNYAAANSYFIGTPTSSHHNKHFLRVERAEWRKNTQDRVGEMMVMGDKGDNSFVGKAIDPATRDWIKRPRRIINSTDAHNEQQATHEAWEEIFESKVGSVEWRIVIENPGFVIRQNRMAFVNIPKIGLKGEFYVVGTRVSVDEGGFYQEIRLREKNYAISRRKPDDPVLDKGHDDLTTEQIAATTGNIGINAHGVRWWDYFVKAARQTHGQFGFSQWLAFLLGACEGESHFKNECGYGTEDWYAPPNRAANAEDVRAGGGAYQKWIEKFANESPTRAVGPMQLYSSGLKHQADAHGPAPGMTKAQAHNNPEYLGGRWNPEWNILEGAKSLAEWGRGYPGRESYFREIYAHYNGGTHPPGESYAYYDRVVGPAYRRFNGSVKSWVTQDTTASPTAGTAAPGNWNHYVVACVNFLKKQVGKQYQYAAAGPNEYDCSGLAGQAWRVAGVNGCKQFKMGDRIPPWSTFGYWGSRSVNGVHLYTIQKQHIMPGDWLLFGTPRDVHHMGVAIGDGHFIEAKGEAWGVIRSSISSRSDLVGVLRHPQMWTSISG